MEFHQYVSLFNIHRKEFPKSKLKSEEYYKLLNKKLHMERVMELRSKHGFEMANDQTANEYFWYLEKCPYYNVYPGIINPLCNLKLENVLGQHIQCEHPHILFRFPKGKCPIGVTFNNKRYEAKVSLCSIIEEKVNGLPKRTLSIWTDFGDADVIGEIVPVYIFRNIPLKQDETIEQTMGNLPIDFESINQGLPVSQNELDKVTKVIISSFLLSKNSEDELIQPDVLADDATKFANADDSTREKLFLRAQRRGKFGWNIGKNIEVSPHFRNPHPALYWMGEQRKTPKIIFRKGTFIHKEVIKNLPTGFQQQ